MADEQRARVVDAASYIPPIISDSTVADEQRARIVDAASINTRLPATAQGQPLEGQVPSRCDLQETKTQRVGVPLNDGRLGPLPSNGQHTGNHREAIGIAEGAVVDRRKGIGPRPQANRILCAVRIGCGDGVNQAPHVSGATLKGFCLDHCGVCQSEPEGYHSRHTPGDTPPEPPLLACAGMRSHDVHLLFQGFKSLTQVVHAAHVLPLLW